MMSGEAWLYLLAVLINAVNLFLQVFFTIMYSDLEWYVFCHSFVVLNTSDSPIYREGDRWEERTRTRKLLGSFADQNPHTVITLTLSTSATD